MATEHDELKSILLGIESSVDRLYAKIPANVIEVIGGLSDIDSNLGLVMAGEFRVGNNVRPGDGFSGVRMGYPAFTYDSADWNIVGINNDVLQFGLLAFQLILVLVGLQRLGRMHCLYTE